jgi:hypothetical protein
MEGGYDRGMKVRIGISTTDKLLEIEVEDAKVFKKEMERAVAEGGLGWFSDSKGRTVGIPARSVAFIEIEDAGEGHTVGFAPAV